MTQHKEKARYKYIRISFHILIKILTGNTIGDILLTPLPSDAKFIRSGTDSLGNTLAVIESKEFDEIDPDADEIPFFGHLKFKRGSIPSSDKGVH